MLHHTLSWEKATSRIDSQGQGYSLFIKTLSVNVSNLILIGKQVQMLLTHFQSKIKASESEPKDFCV